MISNHVGKHSETNYNQMKTKQSRAEAAHWIIICLWDNIAFKQVIVP
jgi:hypothetical protein